MGQTPDMDENTLFQKLKTYLPKHLGERLTPGLSADDVSTVLVYLAWLHETLATYLPRYLVKLISADPTPGQVQSHFRHGTVLLADVSGFTPMAERLSALGKEGAEEITGIVNSYCNTMLEISARYGGDLLKFGGDSLLVLFEGFNGPRRAVVCAQAMQRAMGRFAHVQTSQGDFTLQMSVGIGSGPVFLAHLGTAEKMEYAVMGSALSNMARAESKAGAKQIIVDRITRDAVQHVAIFDLAGDDFWLLKRLSRAAHLTGSLIQDKPAPVNTGDASADPLAPLRAYLNVIESLRPFVPDALLAHLVTNPQQPTLPGSHRPVTVMFANFYGIGDIINTLGPGYEETINAILNIHFGAMSRILARYGGLINKVDTFARGHRIVALFGALRAHEDDPLRATHAALEMNQALDEVNRRTHDILANLSEVDVDFGDAPLKQRISLNSGFVFAGNIGSDTRREYSVMGDEVNLAARLMGVAQPGQVLISHSTARRVDSHFYLSEDQPVKVKGKARPVRNFVVSGLRERALYGASVAASPLVGRDEELEIGQETVDRARAGDGVLLVISGAAGIGKTRLTQELILYSQSVGMDLLAGGCLSYGKTMPYHPWTDVLRAYFGFQHGDDAPTRAQTVQAALETLDETLWSPIIGDVLGLDIPDNELTQALDAKLRRQRLLDLTLKLLQTRSASQPLLLIIEDAHWADPASTDLINYVARNIGEHPILLILSQRPDQAAPDWADGEHSTHLALDDLDDAASLEIVRGMLGPLALPDALQDLILSKGGGNPFFIEEVVRALVDAGALRQEALGAWQLEHSVEAIALPDTIHGVIISRVDRLPQVERQVLQVAAVMGRIFSRRVLDNVYPYDKVNGTLQRRLERLSSLGLIEMHSPQQELYRFKHMTTWDVVYESQAFEQRRSLHRRIAHFIESESSDSLSEQTDLLAYHYWEGHDWDKATEYNLLAARRAQREFANEAAVTAYRRTLQAATRTDTDTAIMQLVAHESQGEVLTLLGQYDEALEYYNSARAMVESRALSRDQKLHLADLCRKTADVYERRSEYDSAFNWLEKGLDYLDECEPCIEMARIYLLGTGIYRRQGKNDQALEWCFKGLDTASKVRTFEAQQVVAQACYNLGGIHNHRGDLHRAVKFCRESVDIYQEINDVVGLSQAYINLANAYSDQGDWERASEALRESLSIKQKIGDVLHQGFILNNLANIHLYRGDWSQAADLYEQSHAIWKQLGATLPKAVTLSNLAQVHIYQENWSQSQDLLNRSQALFAESGSEDFLPELERRWGEFYLGRASAESADLDQALIHTRRSIVLAAAQEARLETGMSLRVLGRVHMARGELVPAQAALRQSLQIFNDLNSPYQAGKTLLCLAQLAAENGPTQADLEQLAQAIQTFEQLGAQADLDAALALQKVLAPD